MRLSRLIFPMTYYLYLVVANCWLLACNRPLWSCCGIRPQPRTSSYGGYHHHVLVVQWCVLLGENLLGKIWVLHGGRKLVCSMHAGCSPSSFPLSPLLAPYDCALIVIARRDRYPVDTGLFVSGAMDGVVKLWDTNTLGVVLEFDFEDKVLFLSC